MSNVTDNMLNMHGELDKKVKTVVCNSSLLSFLHSKPGFWLARSFWILLQIHGSWLLLCGIGKKDENYSFYNAMEYTFHSDTS